MAYHLLFEHLSHELSMECLLSLTEFTHFMQFIVDTFDVESVNDIKIITLPQNIPRSRIVQEECQCDEKKYDSENVLKPTIHIDNIDNNNDNNNINNSSNDKNTRNKKKGNDLLRQHSTICQCSDLKKCKIMAYNLYIKYIKTDSAYEINISDEMRNELTNLMGDLSKWLQLDSIDHRDLLLLFEDACHEMKKFISASLTRMKTKPKLFNKLVIALQQQSKQQFKQ